MIARDSRGRTTLHALTSWVDAVRLRTLPLALASILTGVFVALARGRFSWSVDLLALATALFLQILSNLANDYGDAVKGADNSDRVGPPRAVQSGRITPHGMRQGIVVASLLALASGCALLYASLGASSAMSLLFLLLGLAAILAAIRYTVGRRAYGYRGLGDLVVFFFFGLVGVAGTYYLNALDWDWDVLLPAASIGALSTGVLNLNNMRDLESDRIAGKRTVAALLGLSGARTYQAALVGVSIVAASWYVARHAHWVGNFLFVIVLPFFVRDLVAIFHTREKRGLDPFLGKLTLSSLAFSMLFGLGLIT